MQWIVILLWQNNAIKMIIFWHDIERNLILLLLYNKEPSIVSLLKHKKNECCLKWTNTCLKCIILENLITQCTFRQEKGTFRHSQTISQRECFLKCQKSVLKCKNWYKLIYEARFKHENWLFRQTLIHSDCEVIK